MKAFIHHINGACYASLILIAAYAYGQHQAQAKQELADARQQQGKEVAFYDDMLEQINPKAKK